MTLKSTALGAIAMLAAGPAFAGDLYFPPSAPPAGPLYAPTPMVIGHVDIVGGFFSGSGDAQGSGGTIGGAGRVNVPLRNLWNMQIDLQGTAWFSTGAIGNHSDVGIFAHFYKRVPDRFAWGPFIGYERIASSGFGVGRIGIEGYWNVPTGLHEVGILGQASAGYLNAGSGSGSMLQLRGEGQMWLTNNFPLYGDLMWTRFNTPGGVTNVLTGVLGGGLRFDNSPFGLFGEARLDHYSGITSGNVVTVQAKLRTYIDPPGYTAYGHREEGPLFDVPTTALNVNF